MSVVCEIEYVWYVCENVMYVSLLVVVTKVFIGNLLAKGRGVGHHIVGQWSTTKKSVT